ncbi:MAG TPA: phosphatase PAP2 family protein [Gemmatimonadales bacterium]|jgi:membrane-associated phospholipid phosphatase
MDGRRSPLGWWLIGLIATTIAVLFCIQYVDRPVATYVETNLRHGALFEGAYDVLRPLPLLAVIALIWLGVQGFRMPAAATVRHRTSVVACWAIAWGLAMAEVLKHLFGRSQTYPEWALERIYRFHFLHGHEGYDAFPSGTMSVGGAVLAVLWLRLPRLRPLWAAILLLIIFLLVVTDSHWVSDIIGGTFVGISVGWLTTNMLSHE